MSLARQRIGDVFVLRPGPRLDVATSPEFETAVLDVFEGGVRNLVVDLSGVEYISSVGLGAVLKCAKSAQEAKGRAALAGLTEPVAKVFEISGLTHLFEIHVTSDDAVMALSSGVVAPRAPEAPPALTLPEEILLLAVRDEGGTFVDLPQHSLEYVLAGSVVMDLGLRRRIDSDLERVEVVDSEPLDDAILDPALAAMSRSREIHDARFWIDTLAQDAAAIRERVLSRLVKRGILSRDESRLRWVLGKRRYPVINDQRQREVKERILAIVGSDEIPSPHDAAVIALAEACAVFDAIIDPDTLLELRPRIVEIARMDLMARTMNEALEAAQARAREGGKAAAPSGAPEAIYDRA